MMHYSDKLALENIKAEIIWRAGPHLDDVLVHANPKVYLMPDKKFSDYEYIIVHFKLSTGHFVDDIRKLTEWIELSSKIETARYLLAAHLSDTTWEKRYGIFQLAGAGIQAIYGAHSIKEIEHLKEE